MRTAWGEVTVDAIDYEMIRLSEGSAVTELGRFGDVFSSAGPPWRLVAGYLMLAARTRISSPIAGGRSRRVQSWPDGGATGTDRLGGFLVARAPIRTRGRLARASGHPARPGHRPRARGRDVVVARE